jgi:hypothetical protein
MVVAAMLTVTVLRAQPPGVLLTTLGSGKDVVGTATVAVEATAGRVATI